jgi:hypothetical protein
MIPMRAQLPDIFGPIVNGKWANENQFMVYIEIPDKLKRPNYKHIYCNKVMKDALLNALNNIINRGYDAQVKTFDGCFMIRNTRGSPLQSVHSWGLAVDINAATNQLNTVGDMSPELVKCFTDENFVWGGTFHRCDPMHFQYVIE